MKKKTARKQLTPDRRKLLCGVRRVLIKANRLLTPETWITGNSREYDLETEQLTGMCAIGAAMEARERLKLPDDIYSAAKAFLDQATERRTKKELGDVVVYNDCEAKDVTDVKKVFVAARRAVDQELEGR